MKPHHLVFTAAILLSSCAKKSETSEASPPLPAPSEALQKVFAAVPSAEPAAIHQSRTTAKPGDVLTLKGRVMGNIKPFVEGRSIFILGDPEKLTACSDMPGDACETPWDVCCDSPELIKANTATIQVVDADGRVLKEGIEHINGLEKLSTVIVSGKVAEGSTAEMLLLSATAIKVEK